MTPEIPRCRRTHGAGAASWGTAPLSGLRPEEEGPREVWWRGFEGQLTLQPLCVSLPRVRFITRGSQCPVSGEWPPPCEGSVVLSPPLWGPRAAGGQRHFYAQGWVSDVSVLARGAP